MRGSLRKGAWATDEHRYTRITRTQFRILSAFVCAHRLPRVFSRQYQICRTLDGAEVQRFRSDFGKDFVEDFLMASCDLLLDCGATAFCEFRRIQVCEG